MCPRSLFISAYGLSPAECSIHRRCHLSLRGPITYPNQTPAVGDSSSGQGQNPTGGVYPPFKSSLLLFSSSCGVHFCRVDVGSRVSKLEHTGLWICSQITICTDAGAAAVPLPWLCPAMEKSGDALAGRTRLGSRDVPKERCHSGPRWLAQRGQVKLQKPRGEETEVRPPLQHLPSS